MKRVIFLLSLSTFSLLSFAPVKPSWMRYDPYVEKIYKKHCLINDNLIRLKNGETKTRQEVFSLIQPLLDIYLEEYKDNYLIKDSLSYALSCIFVSESSNNKGHSGKSTLWLDFNNPFGLTGKGVTKWSWEEEKGQRVEQFVNFRTYTSLEKTVESLMWDYLLKERYSSLKDKTSVKDFLHGLYDCGYCTSSKASYFWNIQYQKAIQ